MKSLAIKEIKKGSAADSMLRPQNRERMKGEKPVREYERIEKAAPEDVPADIRTYTLRDIQNATGVSVRNWCVFIKQGYLRATKVGRTWLVSGKDFQEFMSHGYRFSARSELSKRQRTDADESDGSED